MLEIKHLVGIHGAWKLSDKTCKFCGETGLSWDHEYHARTGKWRLSRHKGCSTSWVKRGKDRCVACIYNGNKECDPRQDGHMAKI